MTPKEKAVEIFMLFTPDLLMELGMSDETFETNRKFAKICVNQMITTQRSDSSDYLQQVLKEMDNL